MDNEPKSPLQQQIEAYHGSPHLIGEEGFQNRAIGSGEGAQAYGHGHYFAENEGVAKGYRDALSANQPTPIKVGEERHHPYSPMQRIVAEHKGNVDAVLKKMMPRWEKIAETHRNLSPDTENLERYLVEDEHNEAQKQRAEVESMRGKTVEYGPKGHMYHVKINAHPDHFLDWDKPLSEQSFHIGKSIFDARKDNPTLFNVFKPHLEKDSTGMGFYQSLATHHPNGYQGASDFLQRAGIRGIKYLDAGSRNAGEGSRNYVVFDPKDIEIKRRYERGGEVDNDVIPHGDPRREENLANSNNGNFDPSNPNITKSGGGNVEGYATKGYVDPASKHISNWNWRPLEDVHNELGLTEIPSHVHEFGKFMDRTAERAGREGLTPRDLLKAYTITRASIQRRATPAENLHKSGLVLPPDVTGMVRPEGAFGHWLHTPAGQAYLDAAQRGQTHEAAIQDAMQRMKPYGKHNDLGNALRWGAANLPDKAAAVSHLVAAGRENASSPQEWRDFIGNIRGIGPSKAGFVASLMGRGDQPTLDARQVIMHTGRPSKEAQPHIARKGGKGGEEAVDRLAARQTAMNLKTPAGMEPYYQHLAHHAVWDKAGNEMTTHQDVMDAMQHAATGGTIMDHPLAIVMHGLHPEGYSEGGYVRTAYKKGGKVEGSIWHEKDAYGVAHGGSIAKTLQHVHNPAIVEHALNKVGAALPALDPSLMAAKAGRRY
jgi:hypothetical protein